MARGGHSPQPIRFGVFELDLRAGELRKKGMKVKLQEQPFQILALLVQCPGEVVTREELRQKLWPEGTFVDFEHGLNAAINRLRDALDDAPESPRFVETIPRRGYRFIAPVEGREVPAAAARTFFRPLWIAGLAVAVLAVLVGLSLGGFLDLLRGGAAPGEIASLAILPLENLSGDPEQDPFVDGMTDELITQLGKISALERVISRHSAMQYKGTDKPLAQVARELGVDAVIGGSVLRAGDRVRINVQLIQPEPERHLWSESYERDLSDVLALQGQVAGAVAREIEVTLTREERARLVSARSVNPEAYEAYLKGRYFWNKRTEEGLLKGLEYFQQAIETDPTYSAAYAGVADTYILLPYYGSLSPHEAFPKARTAALKALELDDTLAEAHTSLAFLVHAADWDWQGAEREFKRAIALNPSYAPAHHWYSESLAHLGRMSDSIAEAERARELDPLSTIINVHLAHMFYYARQYNQAIEKFKQALEMDPNDWGKRILVGYAYVQKGQHAEAIAEFQAAVEAFPDTPEFVASLGLGYAAAGRKDQARKRLAELEELGQQRYVSPYFPAIIHTNLSEKEQAFTRLAEAYRKRCNWMAWLKIDPRLDPLRSDPRFQSLLRRMNFPED